ncbi:MAG: MTH938/NDUFAF3 family protein [Candidatus Acetothermia bacterium]|jgi:hypothetical protein|nr:MTH938/NDUFAF3 family protein [Candidatus Acetothermia bacterium]
MVMRLTGYRFGRIEVDGVPYHHDLAILETAVREWRRREGHRVHPEDIQDALAERPELLIVGTGHSGLLQVTAEVAWLLADRGIELLAVKTAEAVDAYNDLARAKRVCAMLHLTC